MPDDDERRHENPDTLGLKVIEDSLDPFARWLDANPNADVNEYDGFQDPPDKARGAS